MQSSLRNHAHGHSPLSRRFGVQAIPTLLVLRGGQVAARQTGAAPRAVLRAWLDTALAVAAH
jgi:thioredoxin 2